MKKIKNHRLFFRLIIILFSIPLCIWCFSLSFPILRVCADGEKVQTQLEETIVEELNRLDLERLEDYLKSLQGFNEKSVVDYLLDYVKGVDFDYKSLSHALLDIFFNLSRMLILCGQIFSHLPHSIHSDALISNSESLPEASLRVIRASAYSLYTLKSSSMGTCFGQTSVQYLHLVQGI